MKGRRARAWAPAGEAASFECRAGSKMTRWMRVPLARAALSRARRCRPMASKSIRSEPRAAGAVELHRIAELVEGRGGELGDLAVRPRRHVEIDRGAVGMRLVRGEVAAPGPARLGVDEAQVRVRPGEVGVGIAHGVAHLVVHEGAPQQVAEQAVGAVVLARVGQTATALEAAVGDAAAACAGRAEVQAEPCHVQGEDGRDGRRQEADPEQDAAQSHTGQCMHRAGRYCPIAVMPAPAGTQDTAR